MSVSTNRRSMLALLASAPLLALPGCAGLPGFSLTEAVRELLTLSSQRAFDRLLQPGGFYDREITRIDLPPELGGPGATSLVSRVLASRLFKDRLAREINRAAERGAERAAPLVADAIRTISIADAAAIIRGGPSAATDLLEQAMGRSLVGAIFPAIDEALRLADNDVIAEALRLSTGIDLQGLAHHISDRAHTAIYRAIAEEEAAIRANPRETRNPLLIGAFGLGS